MHPNLRTCPQCSSEFYSKDREFKTERCPECNHYAHRFYFMPGDDYVSDAQIRDHLAGMVRAKQEFMKRTHNRVAAGSADNQHIIQAQQKFDSRQ